MSSPRVDGSAISGVGVVKYDSSVTVRSLMKSCGINFIGTPGVTEIAINGPGAAWTESSAGWTRHELPDCSFDRLMKLANALAIFNKAQPPLSASEPIKPVRLPDGERGQIVIPPACEPDTVSLTIRIPSTQRFTVEQLAARGNLSGYWRMASSGLLVPASSEDRASSLDKVVASGELSLDGYDIASPRLAAPAALTLDSFQLEMLEALEEGDIVRFLTLAITHKLNIVLVGGTGSGKTTLMKALADLVPAWVRVATIEDTHELPLPMQPNHVHLFYSDVLPARELVKATLRMKFDRVYLAELRGDETWDYLTLLNTGHNGGMTTVHANDCIAAFSRIATLIKQSPVGQTLDWNYLLREVKMTIDVVLFMEKHKLTQVYYDPVEKLKLQRGLA